MESLYENKRVLLADDSITIRQILMQGLRQLGFQLANIKAVGNGNIAFAQTRENEFDLIISDWDMPGMDGLELLKKMRESRETENIPFIMVSAKRDEESVELALRSGANQYINKPFSVNHLGDVIEQILINSKKFENKKALIVDDSKPMREIVIKSLIQTGFRKEMTVQAGDGEEAFRILEKDHFDLVITDWNMPNIDGLRLIKMIKANANLKKIPVLMVSSEMEKENIIRAIKEGACQYILKPFNPLELQKRIQQVFYSN